MIKVGCVSLICAGLVVGCSAGSLRLTPSPTAALSPTPLATAISQDCAGAENTFQQACTSPATGLHYWLAVPAEGSIQPGEKPPLILYLHGFNHSGSLLKLVLNGGMALQVEQGREIGALVASPQCPSGQNWQTAEMVEQLSRFVDELVTSYGADRQRVYLTGFSMGGDGAWALGTAHPEQFAAVAPVGSWYAKNERVCALKSVPVWVFQGEKDEIVAPSFAKNLARVLEECGGDVRLTLFPKAGHEESSSRAYGMDELYEWMLEQVKGVQEKHDEIPNPYSPSYR